MSVNREALAWAAGFFDGEGCTYVGSRQNRNDGTTIGLQVSQSGLSNDIPPAELVRFQEAVLGLGRIRNRNAARKEGYKFSWDWRVNTWVETQAVGALLFEFWSATKRQQWLDRIMEFKASSSFGRGIGRPLNKVCKRGHNYSEVIYTNNNGARRCLECVRILDRQYKARKAQKETK